MRVGFMQIYNEANWVGFAIEQAMRLCDKLLVIEGSQFTAFPDIPERSDDGTLDIISDKMREHRGRILLINTARRHKNYRQNQCANFNRGLDFCDIDDYFLILDADDFFTDEWLERANAIMQEGDMDLIYANSRDFSFGFNWVVGFGRTSPRLVVLKKNAQLHFVPTHKVRGGGDRIYLSKDISRYHYMWVKPSERLRVRMRTSGRHAGMTDWFESVWCKMELKAGKVYQSYNGKFTLRRYDGVHPSILNTHPWRYVEDIRRLGI